MFGYKCMFYVVLLDVAQRIESSVRSQMEEEQCISLFSVVEDNDIVAGVILRRILIMMMPFFLYL